MDYEDASEDEEYESQFKGNMIWLLRLVAHEYGLQLEQATRPQHEHLVYDYCCKKLARLRQTKKLFQYRIELVEFDEVVQLDALIHKDHAEDFGEFLHRAQGAYLWFPNATRPASAFSAKR